MKLNILENKSGKRKKTHLNVLHNKSYKFVYKNDKPNKKKELYKFWHQKWNFWIKMYTRSIFCCQKISQSHETEY